MVDRSSRCAAGDPLAFVFYPTGVASSEDAIAAAANLFYDVMHRNGRLWSPHSWPLERRRFSRRLEAALQGELRDVEHVKDIDRGRHEFLFEIRWDIDVAEADDSGARRHGRVPVRLYHAEPSSFTDVFVGLHLHEKEIVDGDRARTNALQDIQIDRAIWRFHEGRPLRWGIT